MTSTIFGINIYGLLINLFFLAIIGSVTVLKSVTIETGADYFLAITKGKWMTLGASIFITILSSEYFFYILLLKLFVGINAFTAIAASILAVIFVTVILVPRFISSSSITITHFLAGRLNNSSLVWITKSLLFLYTFIKLSLIVFISGLLLQEILKIDMISCMLFIIFFTGVCTLVGGLATMVSLHLIQTAGVLFPLLYFFAFGRNIFEINTFLISIRDSFLKISGVFFNNEISTAIVLIFLFLLGVWYWGFDQRIFQRIISIGSFRQTLKTYLLSIGLFSLTVFILINYLFSESIYSNGNLLMNPQERHLLPFESGILMLGIFSWLMSSLSATFHSFSSHIAFDIYKPYYPNASQQELVLVARLALTVLVLATILLVPLMKLASLSFFIYSFGFFLVLLFPLSAVFFCIFLLNKISVKGVFLSFIISGLLITIKFVITIFNVDCSGNSFLFFVNLNFSNLALLLFLLSGLLILSFSFWEKKDGKLFFSFFSQGFMDLAVKHEKVTDVKVNEIFKQI